jgi:hypothetical protein
MASTDLNIPISNLMRYARLNVNLTGVPLFRARLTLGGWILKLAALVMGVGLHVDMEPRPSDSGESACH